MKRVFLSFFYLFLSYIFVSLSFISLGLYPAFASFGLEHTLSSHSLIAFFPLATIFFVRSLMFYFAEDFCVETKKNFLINTILSLLFAITGYLTAFKMAAVIALSLIYCLAVCIIFALSLNNTGKKHFSLKLKPKNKISRVKSKKVDFKKVIKLKPEAPSQQATTELEDIDSDKEIIENSKIDKEQNKQKKTPFLISSNNKKSVLPKLKSFGSKDVAGQSNDNSASDSDDQLQERLNLIRELEEKKLNESLEKERKKQSTTSQFPTLIKPLGAKSSILRQEAKEDIDEEDIDEEDNIEDDELNIEINDDEDEEVIYSSDDEEEESENIASRNRASKFDDTDDDIEEKAEKKVAKTPNRFAENENVEDRLFKNDKTSSNDKALEKEREKEQKMLLKKQEEEKKLAQIAKEEEMKMGVGRLKRKDRSIRKWHYELPSSDFLVKHKSKNPPLTEGELEEYQNNLIDALKSYSIEGTADGYVAGPTAILFKIELGAGVKASKLSSVSDDIARYLGVSASGLRIIPTIPGTHDAGIEIPNPNRQTISFMDTFEGLKNSHMSLPFALGKSIIGEDIVIDIAKTPHLLLAGSTGSGKSVSLNSMIASLLYTKSPEDVRFIIVDPKQVELQLYNDIPHLLTPVIIDAKAAIKALDYCIEEMERRYSILSELHVRNIIDYNKRIRERHMKREKMPYIVVIIDEFADLMSVVGKDLEQRVSRLAAKARAIGIHLVLATQRPSVEVITGTLKNNIPTRIAFRVSSYVDSKTILDTIGAEKLLGYGDMLLKSQTESELLRIQGSFLDDNEVDNIVSYVKSQDTPDYIDDDCLQEVEEIPDEDVPETFDYTTRSKQKWNEKDERYLQAAWDLAMEKSEISASALQRCFSVGFNTAGRIIDEMEDRGIIGPKQGAKSRKLLKFKNSNEQSN